ncbi:RVS161-like protein [Candida tropicalis]
MSWIGIKKAINRAGTQVMLKTGHIEQTVDKEFDYQEKRYRAMETNSLKLQKNLRSYLESLRILTNSQINIAESLNSFYGNNSTTSNVKDKDGKELKNKELVQEYYATVKQLNDSSIKNLENPYNQTVLNPIARFNSYYTEINEVIKKRNNKLLDYDAMKSKVKKLIEHPSSTDMEQYENKLKNYNEELKELEDKYISVNNKLIDELPKLINLRVSYFDPSFESFVKIQLRFFNENYYVLNQLQLKLDAQTKQDYMKGKLEDRIDNVLNKMRGLDITGGL